MKLIRNRKFAITITVAAVILATFIGLWGNLNGLARQAEALFYADVYTNAEGITQRGIYTHLVNISNSALGLATMPVLSENNELKGAASALLSARDELMNAMNARDVRRMGLAYSGLQRSFEAVRAGLERISVSQRDREDIDRYISTYTGAGKAISENSYNRMASAYLDEASVLARFLVPGIFLKHPQTF